MPEKAHQIFPLYHANENVNTKQKFMPSLTLTMNFMMTFLMTRQSAAKNKKKILSRIMGNGKIQSHKKFLKSHFKLSQYWILRFYFISVRFITLNGKWIQNTNDLILKKNKSR